MSEQSFLIAEELRAGLRKREKSFRGAVQLEGLLNARPFVMGLEALPHIIYPMNRHIVDWPFPQFFKGKELLLIASASEIYEPDTSVFPWTTRRLQVFTLNGEPCSLPRGGRWDFVDFGESFFLTNGKVVVFRFSFPHLLGSEPKVYASTSPTISTGCYCKGRVFFGGLSVTEALESFLSKWLEGTPFTIEEKLTKNYVFWSSVGGEDALFLFFPSLLTEGFLGKGFDESNPFYFQYLKRNQVGLRKLPCPGEVLAVRPLNEKVIAYSTGGVFAFIPIEDPPTYGLTKLLDFGVPYRGAVCAAPDRHVFVDVSGRLWSLSNEGLQLLGYQEYFEPILDSEIVSSYDPAEGDFYICSRERSFILSQTGLAELTVKPTSLVSVNGKLYGAFLASGPMTFELETTPFDLGSRALKTIDSVEVGAKSFTDIEVSVLCGYELSGEFKQTPWVPVNSSGRAEVRASGVDFKLLVRASTHQYLEVDYLRVNWRPFGTLYAKDPAVGVR